MKILSLRFKNLNSLAGEWKIDFTDQQFDTDGLFFDYWSHGLGQDHNSLMPFAWLFTGERRRLGNFSENSNEIMHRSRMECMAEVTLKLRLAAIAVCGHIKGAEPGLKSLLNRQHTGLKALIRKLVSEVRSIF